MSIREIGFEWNLRRIMAAHNMWKTTDLHQPLLDRGVNLSAAQVYRLVTETPERLSMTTLAALCDIFDCAPSDLIEISAMAAKSRAVATAARARTSSSGVRPRRARILTEAPEPTEG